MPPHDPIRRCILSGAHEEQGELIRLALGPDGCVLPDLQARAPGRGAWVSPDRALIREAISKGRMKGALARAFKGDKADVPADLDERIETGLARLFFDRLGLEMRAGHLIYGTARIESALRSGQAHLLLHANDAAADGSAKLDRLAYDVEHHIVPASRARISMALGRENIVHAALIGRASAERVKAALARWAAFAGNQENSVEGAPDLASDADVVGNQGRS